ncbi:U-box domain-containing protein 30 [Apostasia shenzhenica]|uniref:U-box domain-containing protein n=1 Tax=Apostasia shenzhenica TaxID=1088818 RepID=A0A2I0BFC2_9ASPA|nr:U-box domain-containing protein 30 [Apostasia shenzhenica]
MPLFQQRDSWSVDGGGQVLDLETAVKDGILGSAAAGGGALAGGTTEKLDLKKMIEKIEPAGADDVPSVFICPISLDAMVDPVTLCTGQTYERANILKWLSMGHRTCPTTMQELWDDAVTPNKTLHQLIHTWFSQRYLLMKKRSEDVGGRTVELLDTLSRVKGQARIQALKELGNLVSSHLAAAKKAFSDAGSGGLALLLSLIGPFTSHAVGSDVIAILANLPLDSDAKANLMQPSKISVVVDILNEGTIDTKISCARLLELLMEDKNFRSEILSSLSLLVGLLRLVKNGRHPNGVAAGLRLLKRICSQQQQVRGLMLSVGAVPQLVDPLQYMGPDCLELALEILEELASLPQGRAALKDCPQTIPAMVKLLMRVSEACTQLALSILWTVCKLAPDECAPVAVEAGLAAKLLLVIQSGCNPCLKQRSAELLKLCSLNYTATIFMSKCKLTRTIQ